MKLYTRTGDQGSTSLFGGSRVSKASPRVAAYGDVDELNSLLGVVRAGEPWPELDLLLQTIQSELFELGMGLASPPEKNAEPLPDADAIKRLEREIDRAAGAAQPLSNFILPGGAPLGAWLHLARTVCRRVERSCVALNEIEGGMVNDDTIIYLNRLSDLLFALAREANARAGQDETTWQAPKPDRP